jgi:hypothetical protein
MINAMSADDLLVELSRECDRFDSYADLERCLGAVMRQHHDRLSAHVSASDVLDLAARRGLVQRDGSQLVITPAQAVTAH